MPFRSLSVRISALTLAASLAACSSSKSSPSTAGTDDAGADAAPTPTTQDAAPDSAPPDIPEPTYGGVVEPGCQVDGCIHAFAGNAKYTKPILVGNAAPGFTVLNGVDQYNITYYSDGREITGSVFVPDTTPPADGFGVVVMNQFTSGIGASCAPSAGLLSLGVASAAALSGFITLVPDGTSYGTAPYGGYMLAKVAGRAALDGARAALHLNVKPTAQRVVIAGLSQGAFSTMAAATELPGYAPHLAVRGFAAAEPPSNLATGFQAGAVADQTNIVYDAMRLYSWQGALGLSGGQIFRAPYDTNAPMWFASACIYNGADGSSGTLYNDFPNNASSVLSDAFLGYAKGNTWPDDWAAVYAASANLPKGLTQPVLIFEGSADVTVLPANAAAYVQQLQAAGVNVDFRQIQGGTHGTTALSSFTTQQVANDQAVAWITTQLAN